MEQLTFGALLKLYRERGASGQGVRWKLTQARFGERIEDVLGLAPGTYRAQVVSKWELDQTIIPASNRLLLTAIIQILVQEERITAPSDADRLLNSGGYQSLTAEEMTRFFPDWGTTAATPPDGSPAGGVDADPATPAPEQTTPRSTTTSVSDSTVGRWQANVGWSLLSMAVILGVAGLAGLAVQAQPVSPGFAPWALIFSGLGLAAAVVLLWPVARHWSRRPSWPAGERTRLVEDACGEKPFPLGHQRLLITAALGAYFAELLEREPLYVDLPGQIDAALGNATELPPLQQLLWSLMDSRGPQVVVLAGDGGFGKSTLAAKIVRCLFERQAIDLVLGDSAKVHVVDPVTGSVSQVRPALYASDEFATRLSEQLGLPPNMPDTRSRMAQARDRLAGRRAVVVVDNLETVTAASELLLELRRLASRDVRIIVTTRSVSGLVRASGIAVVHVHGIASMSETRTFIRWHIRTHAAGHPALARLDPELDDPTRLKRLLHRTGGSPLLLQLVVSDIARLGWSVLDQMPNLFGTVLLGYLYDDRWQELMEAGKAGRCACRILGFVAAEQARGKPVTVERLSDWLTHDALVEFQAEALRLLQERFLLTLRDAERGYLSILPSLAQFVRTRSDEF